jgi:hypothetical protein
MATLSLSSHHRKEKADVTLNMKDHGVRLIAALVALAVAPAFIPTENRASIPE